MAPMEPSADLRQLANVLMQCHVALLAEGFSEDQSLKILGHILAATQGGGS
jgi:hypothetical protein